MFRGAKLEEMLLREVSLTALVRSYLIDEFFDFSYLNKENKFFDRSDGREGKFLISIVFVDSGFDSDVSYLFI